MTLRRFQLTCAVPVDLDVAVEEEQAGETRLSTKLEDVVGVEEDMSRSVKFPTVLLTSRYDCLCQDIYQE